MCLPMYAGVFPGRSGGNHCHEIRACMSKYMNSNRLLLLAVQLTYHGLRVIFEHLHISARAKEAAAEANAVAAKTNAKLLGLVVTPDPA